MEGVDIVGIFLQRSLVSCDRFVQLVFGKKLHPRVVVIFLVHSSCLIEFGILGWFDDVFGGNRWLSIGLLRSTLPEQKFLKENGIDRLFEDHPLESFKTASFNNMIFVIVEGRHQYNGKIGRFLLYRLI